MTSSPTRRVLFICHNHPSVRPGGAEGYALEVHQALREVPGWSPVFLARGGPPVGHSGRNHEGTLIAPVDGRDDEYFIFTDGYTYDWLNGGITDKDFYTHHLAAFLADVRPDVVHVQHVNFLGYDMLRTIRDVLPDAPIVFTLHEYTAICHRDGQMLRTLEDELCERASPRRCHECFPHFSAQQFFMRTRLIQSHLQLVDLFVSPSRFLIERYVEWGIPRDRIVHEENGRALPPRGELAEQRTRDRFAFFGQASAYKGLDVVLEAFRLLAADDAGPSSVLDLVNRRNGGLAPTNNVAGPSGPARPHLYVHGANLDLQSSEHQSRVAALADATAADVTWVGRYRQEQLPALMEAVDWVIVPSIWWENAPLVIQEALHFGRPVICSDIGGMAEKVRNGIDGLHFRAGDARDLARVIRHAASSSELWPSLHAGTGPAYAMHDHVAWLVDVYDRLAAARTKEVARAN